MIPRHDPFSVLPLSKKHTAGFLYFSPSCAATKPFIAYPVSINDTILLGYDNTSISLSASLTAILVTVFLLLF